MARLTSFTAVEPVQARPDFDLEVRGLGTVLATREVGVFRGGILLAKMYSALGVRRVETFGDTGTTRVDVRLRPYYASWMASHLMRAVPVMELAPEGRKVSAAYWLHAHPIQNQPKPAPHRFRLLPREHFPTRAHAFDGNLLVRAHGAWRDADREEGLLLGFELVEERDPDETLFAALGLMLLSREVSLYTRFGM